MEETKDKEEEQISNMDPRKQTILLFMFVIFTNLGDLEIKLLKARLEQTEAALERIVAHMGSVTDRLARNGVMVGGDQVQCYNIGRVEES